VGFFYANAKTIPKLEIRKENNHHLAKPSFKQCRGVVEKLRAIATGLFSSKAFYSIYF